MWDRYCSRGGWKRKRKHKRRGQVKFGLAGETGCCGRDGTIPLHLAMAGRVVEGEGEGEPWEWVGGRRTKFWIQDVPLVMYLAAGRWDRHGHGRVGGSEFSDGGGDARRCETGRGKKNRGCVNGARSLAHDALHCAAVSASLGLWDTAVARSAVAAARDAVPPCVLVPYWLCRLCWLF
jgi:hypothetical protein